MNDLKHVMDVFILKIGQVFRTYHAYTISF